MRRVSHTQAWYEYARDDHHSELIEEGFRWLDEHSDTPRPVA